MPEFYCKVCSYNTCKKSSYTKHLTSAKHKYNQVQNDGNKHPQQSLVSFNYPKLSQTIPKLSLNNPNLSQQHNSLYKCKDCNQEYAQKNNLYRHRKHFCKEVKGILVVKTGNNNDIVSTSSNKEHTEQWKKDLNNLLVASNTNNSLNNSQNTNTTTNSSTNHTNSYNHTYHNSNNSSNINSNNTNSNNNVQQNIVVNNFNKDNWDHVSEKDKIELLKNPRNMIKLAFKKVNLNKDIPENHNIRVENRRNGKVLIWEDEMWRNEDKDGTLRVVVDEKYYILDSFFKDLLENHPERLNKLMTKDEINAYTKFSAKFDEETNLQNVNHPDRQPLNNQLIEDCFYSLVDELINAKRKKQEENEKKEQDIENRRNERRKNKNVKI
jgi:hypothetical protein